MKVGTPRCGVPAPCRRGTGVHPAINSWPWLRSIPPLNAAGTAQRAIPTLVSPLPGRNGHEISGLGPFDQLPELIEEHRRVMWARRRFGVVLDAIDRLGLMAHPFHCLVVQVDPINDDVA